MHTFKLRSVIDERQQLHLHLQLPLDTPSGEAEVTVIVAAQSTAANSAAAVNPTPMASPREFFAKLDADQRPRLSAEEVDRWIEEERNAWD